MRRIPSIPSASLRDHGGTERVERIWRRIQPDLLGAGRSLPRPSPSIWIPAALAGMFAAGIFVGAKWVRPSPAPSFTAERALAPEPAPRPATATERTATPTEQPRTPQARKSRPLDPAEPTALITLVPQEALPILQSAPAGPPEWERLANDDRYDEARAALEAHGGFAAVLAGASAAQLMTLVDIARSAGRSDQAILALRRFVDAFPEASGAPEAALTLGNLLEKAGDSAGAAEAAAIYRRLSPSGDFAEDALARQVDSALAKGNLEELVRLVAQYENDFPNGPRLEQFRAELARRAAGGPASVPDDGDERAPAGNAKDPVTPETPKAPSK